MISTLEPTLYPTESMWSTTDASYSSTVDQLLSPGFSMSEDVYQYLLSNGENGLGGFDAAVIPMLGGGPMGFQNLSQHIAYSL
jgi:hypothetical protein